MPFKNLFLPGRIGSMQIKNRFVMPPMVRNYADKNGYVTDRYVAHIKRIAQGGVGMMILEASFIRPDGKGFVNELGIHTDKTIPGLTRLATATHASGAKIGIQLYHAGRQTSSKITGVQPSAPSSIPDPTVMEVPHALSREEIAQLVKAYGKAAFRAKKAGLDFVEIHGAHGYLITQFLSPFSNRRKDAYGGSFKNRLRFLEEVFGSVRRAVGKDYPILVRLSGDEMVAGGLHLADTVRIAKALENLGADALHISVGNYASYARGYLIPPMAMPDGPIVHLAARVKRVVGIPVIAVAKIRTPQQAEKIIQEKKADFIGIGRTLLSDPDYPKKVQDGRIEEINKCIACNQGCIGRLFAQQDVLCTVNPSCGREIEFQRPKAKKKKVLIIGGGPAGLSAAKTAAERGHTVLLYEKQGRLGGQVNAAAALPYRADWKYFIDTLIRQVENLKVEVILNKEFSPAFIKKGTFDVAIVATGSSPARPNIPGVGRTNVVIARDLIEGWATTRGKVVVAGGGCMGAQVAEAIAEKGHPVTIVEASASIAAEAPSDDRALLLERLQKRKVKILTEHKVMGIGSSSVSIEGPYGVKTLSADTVVMCLGVFPNDGLTNELRKVVRKVVVVGDAHKGGRVTEAVSEGALAALEV